jgi:dienelactone hydrolase
LNFASDDSLSFGGEVIPSEIIRDNSRLREFDLTGFLKQNAKEVRWPELLSCIKALRSQYKRVGVLGYRHGGWSSFRWRSKSHSPPLVDCISAAHPTWLTKEEIDDIGVPVQILAPELKAYANSVIPTKNVPYDYQFFPGVEHAFATRGNPNDEKERRAMVRGKIAQVAWMREWLDG